MSNRDHPRVCGEKRRAGEKINLKEGSPPRLRGKVKVGLFVGHSVRITPAYAGKSRTSAVGCPGCRDHPRVCGEKHSIQ